MISLGCHDISLSYGGNDIIKDISFSLEDGDKLGVVGINGSGKTSLLNILYGEEPSKGEVFRAKDKTVGFLRQNPVIESNRTIYSEALSAFEEITELEIEMEKIHERLDGGEVSLVDRYHNLTESYARLGGYEYKSRTKGVLKGLGFTEEDFLRPVNSLSGGQKTTLMLAILILQNPDIILLDEPTNHLDMEAVAWLEDWLNGSGSTVITVSHDRYFLDKVTRKTLEIERCRGTLYNLPYSKYVEEKRRRAEIYEHQYRNQQKEIARQEAYIEQQRRWNRQRNIVAAESREKLLEKMDKLEAPERLQKSIDFKFGSSISSGNDVLRVENLSMQYGGKRLFSNLDFELKKGNRLFILGPNGCGKSTLLKILTGNETQREGEFFFGYNVKIGYYDQENQRLNPDKRILDEVWDTYPEMPEKKIRAVLSHFLFDEEDVLKPISVLSGGEKARIALAKLMLSDINLLVLDEPTNHLDIPSREVLEEAILSFEGTVIAVSHDRYFIKKLATLILDMQEKPFLYRGGYEDFLGYSGKDKISISAPKKASEGGKEAYLKQKEEKAKRQKAVRRYAAVEDEIESLELKAKELEREIFNQTTDYQKITELTEEKEKIEKKTADLYAEWEELEKTLADM